jgi:hypothetical protein
MVIYWALGPHKFVSVVPVNGSEGPHALQNSIADVRRLVVQIKRLVPDQQRLKRADSGR